MTEIVTCILLTSNQIIFLVQFGINKHSQIFQRLQIALALTGSCNFLKSLKNLLVLIYSKLHSKSFDYLYKERFLDFFDDFFFFAGERGVYKKQGDY